MTSFPIPAGLDLSSDNTVSPELPRVVFHGFSNTGGTYKIRPNIDKPLDVSKYVTSLSWMHSIESPYETMSMVLSFPEGSSQTIIPGQKIGNTDNRIPDPGFWAVLFLPNKDTEGRDCFSAVHWGRCSSIRGSMSSSEDTGIITHKVTLSFESWVSLLARTQMFFTVGDTAIPPSYAFNMKAFGNLMGMKVKNSLGMMKDGPQELFGDLFYLFSDQLLPDTLCSHTSSHFIETDYGYEVSSPPSTVSEMHEIDDSVSISNPYSYSDQIAFVGNKEKCSVYAPLRLTQMKKVVGDGLGSIAQSIPRGSIWNLFRSTFFNVPDVIECFPSLEWPIMYNSLEGRPAKTLYSALGQEVIGDNDDLLEALYTIAEEEEMGNTGLSSGGQLQVDLNTRQRWYDYDSTQLLKSYRDFWTSQNVSFSDLSLDAFMLSVNVDVNTPSPFGGIPQSSVDTLEKVSRDRVRSQKELCSLLGGAMPVLIYRMKPKLFSSINSTNVSRVLKADGAEVTKEGAMHSENVKVNQSAELVSPLPNYEFSSGLSSENTKDSIFDFYSHRPEDIVSLNYSFNDSDRVNALTVNTEVVSTSFMEFPEFIGNVSQDVRSISANSLCMKTLDYPFFPEGINKDDKKTLKDKIGALTEELYMYTASPGYVLGTASVDIKYKPWIKAGMWTSGGNIGGKTTILPDTSSLFPFMDEGWTGYIRSVSHSIQISQSGVVRKRTSLQLTDFHFARGKRGYSAAMPTFPVKKAKIGDEYFIDESTGKEYKVEVIRDENTGEVTFKKVL